MASAHNNTHNSSFKLLGAVSNSSIDISYTMCPRCLIKIIFVRLVFAGRYEMIELKTDFLNPIEICKREKK